MKVPLEQVVVTQHSAGVLLRFEPEVDKGKAKTVLDAAPLPGLEAVFLVTTSGRWVVLTTGERVTVAQLVQAAQELSKGDGVSEADVWFHPGPREEDLELEATWRFERGAPVDAERLGFRDVPTYVQLARRKVEKSEWAAVRWPSHPLAKLAIRAGLPGRGALEVPGALADVALNPWPQDAGENLALVELGLPDGLMLELRAEAELKKSSLSKVVGDTVEAALKLGIKPPKEQLASFDDDVKAPQRALHIYLSPANYWRVESAAERESVSVSKVVHYAWRQAHPYAAAKQVKVKLKEKK